MRDKDLKRLNRRELLEMLIIQTRKVEALEGQLKEASLRLESRELQIKEAGDLAQAVMKLNGIFEAAQNASSQYIENIDIMKERCRKECEDMRSKASNEAARITEEAKKEAERIITEAKRAASRSTVIKNGQNKKKKK